VICFLGDSECVGKISVGFLVKAKALEEKKIPRNPASYLDIHKPRKSALG